MVGHLHGTELLMLERIASGAPAAWTHAERWAERMRGWAARCTRLLVSPGSTQRVVTALGVEEDRLVELPNGLDPSVFRRVELDRVALWRRHLVEAPRGWRPGRPPGSVRYREEDLAAFADGPVLLYVGRFTEVKRLGLLIRAFAGARPRLRARSPLVIVGGHPGEWEGEHPIETRRVRAGTRRVPRRLAEPAGARPSCSPARTWSCCRRCASSSARCSSRGWRAACRRSPSTRSAQPGSSQDGETGWLVPPDDESALAEAIVEAVNRPAERARRGERARQSVLERFQWGSIAGRLAAVLESAAEGRAGHGRARALGLSRSSAFSSLPNARDDRVGVRDEAGGRLQSDGDAAVVAEDADADADAAARGNPREHAGDPGVGEVDGPARARDVGEHRGLRPWTARRRSAARPRAACARSAPRTPYDTVPSGECLISSMRRCTSARRSRRLAMPTGRSSSTRPNRLPSSRGRRLVEGAEVERHHDADLVDEAVVAHQVVAQARRPWPSRGRR